MFSVLNKCLRRCFREDIDIDNWAWKLFSRASVAICILGAIISCSSSFFWDPIACHNIDVHRHRLEQSFVNQYCWIHGSYNLIDPRTGESLDGVFDGTGQSCIPSEYYDYHKEGPTKENYQWVTMMLFVHGLIFILPDKIWKYLEGGMINDYLLSNKIDNQNPEEKSQTLLAISRTRTMAYFVSFVVCELLNVVAGIINFCIMDRFLQGKFADYGADVISHYLDHDKVFNPMCSAFPTKIFCTISRQGVGGSVERSNGFCILSQNIINEKIYLIMWFWMVILFGTSTLILMYRCGTIIFPSLRDYELLYRARKGESAEIQELKRYLSVSQWFILCQIGRNTQSSDFNQLLSSLTHHYNNSHESATEEESKNDGIALNQLTRVSSVIDV